MVIKYLKNLFSPHVSVRNLNKINFDYLKNELGIKVLLLDKDDTFTIHHTHELSPHLTRETIHWMIDTYGDLVKVLSNYESDYQMNWGCE